MKNYWQKLRFQNPIFFPFNTTLHIKAHLAKFQFLIPLTNHSSIHLFTQIHYSVKKYLFHLHIHLSILLQSNFHFDLLIFHFHGIYFFSTNLKHILFFIKFYFFNTFISFPVRPGLFSNSIFKISLPLSFIDFSTLKGLRQFFDSETYIM